MKKPILQVTVASLLGMVAATACADSLTRTSAFTYYSNGLLKSEIIEPDDSNKCLVTEYTYDSCGNRISATTRNCNGTSPEAAAPSGDAVFTSRSSSTTFASGTQSVGGSMSWGTCQFSTTSTNALSHAETKEFDPRFGAVTKLTGPNGLATSWTYDVFGRKVSETRADSTTSSWEYNICGTCPTGVYEARETTAGSPTRSAFYDVLNRERLRRSTSFDGTTYVNVNTDYDSLGRVSQVSKPYYATGSGAYTTFTYDILGRVLTQTEPAPSPGGSTATTSFAYSINGSVQQVTTVTNPLSQVETRIKNSQGQLVRVTRQ